MDHMNLNDLRVVDLKKQLELRGLSKSGSKKELIDRLKAVSIMPSSVGKMRQFVPVSLNCVQQKCAHQLRLL